jgi:hypothetical protein
VILTSLLPQDGLISVQDIDPHVVSDDMGREVLAMVKDESASAALTFSEFAHAVDDKLVCCCVFVCVFVVV